MRRTTCGQWVHAACALWTPGMGINAESGLVEGLDRLPKVPTLFGLQGHFLMRYKCFKLEWYAPAVF